MGEACSDGWGEGRKDVGGSGAGAWGDAAGQSAERAACAGPRPGQASEECGRDDLVLMLAVTVRLIKTADPESHGFPTAFFLQLYMTMHKTKFQLQLFRYDSEE